MEGTSGPVGTDPEPAAEGLMEERRNLVGLAYRLLGSISDAEDVAQEAYARWFDMSQEEQRAIDSPGAWLTTVAGRICLDLLRSARVRRERYVGEWLPEPVPGGAEWINGRFGDEQGPPDPADRITLDESIHMAFLVVLETLTPAERVAFILHDVFRYAFAEVADVVGRSPPACRQLAMSARQRLEGSKASTSLAVQHGEIVRDFKSAWEAKDIRGLIGLLDPDVASVADGGGQVPLVYAAVDGADAVADVFAEVFERTPDLSLAECEVNGQPGLVARHDGVIVTVLAFEISGNRITQIWAVRNPQKLRYWVSDEALGAQSDHVRLDRLGRE